MWFNRNSVIHNKFRLFSMKQDLYTRLVYLRKSRLWGKLAYAALKLLGLEIPRSVDIGPGLIIEHSGFGTVIHSSTRIGSRVKLYPGVTVGRADIYRPAVESLFTGVEIGDDVILCPGCKVLGKEGMLHVGRGTVIGANAVLLNSTGENEIWAGIPAKLVGHRVDQPPVSQSRAVGGSVL
jgi:serine O-acetyltransferase